MNKKGGVFLKIPIRYFVLSIILFLVFNFTLLVTAFDTSEITIEPSILSMSGLNGDTFVSSVEFFNTNLTEDAAFNIIYDAPGLSIAPSSIQIDANDSIIIGIFYAFQENVASGNITFEWEGTDIKANVSIDEEVDEPLPPGDGSLDYFPKPPKSGYNIAFYFTGSNPVQDASGFLYCNGYVHSVDMHGGFGVALLHKDAYGPATLFLFGNFAGSKQVTETFDIERSVGKILSVNVPSTSTIGSELTATITYGGEAYGGQDVHIEGPDDEQETQTADNQGKVYFTVTKEGRWKIIANGEGQLATATVNVDYGVLALGLAEDIDENPISVGDMMTIVTEEGANVEVTIDGDFVADYDAPVNGLITLPIIVGGNYVLDGRLDNKRGKFTFYISPQANIQLVNILNMMPVTKIIKDEKYRIEVTDTNGNALIGVESIWIMTPYGTKELLPLMDGVGTWSPFLTGSYMFSLDATSATAQTAKVFIVGTLGGLPGAGAMLMIIIFTIIIFLSLVVIYSKKKGIPLDLMFKSITSMKIFKKKPKIELPF